MEQQGWVKLHRNILQWEWYKDTHTAHLFIHLLISANHEPRKWQGITINRGQLISGRKALSQDTGIPEQSIRTSLNKLKSTNELTIKSTSKYSIYTIVNYDKYQSKDSELTIKSTSQLTNDQPATNHKQECKELNNTTLLNEIWEEVSHLLQGRVTDPSPIIKWTNAGADKDLILTTLKSKIANMNNPPAYLKYYDGAIADAIEYKNNPLQKGNLNGTKQINGQNYKQHNAKQSVTDAASEVFAAIQRGEI